MNNKLFWLVVLLSATLRLWNLGGQLSLYWEETAIGYDAYSILKTGKDYHGNSWPIVAFPSFGDYKPSLYFYSVVPFMAIFGLNEWAVRLPSALAGILAVVLVMAISRELKLDNRSSLLAGLMLAISPWHLQFSRAAFEVNLGTSLFMMGIFGLLRAKNSKAWKWLVLGVVALALAAYTYHGFRILAPLTGLAFVIYFWKNFNLVKVLAGGVFGAVLMGPIFLNINNPIVRQRFNETSHFSQSQAVMITNELRARHGNSLWARVIYHRYWWWTGELMGNYFDQFNLSFLFLEGDGNKRHGTDEFGLLYHWELVSVIAGLGLALGNKKSWLVLMWLLLAPVPAMLTKTTPHALRFLPAVGAFAILSAIGLGWCLGKLGRLGIVGRLGRVGLWAVILVEVGAFWHFYNSHYPKASADSWQYGYKEIVEFTESVKDKYDKIYFTRNYGRPSMYVLFYGKYDPVEIQKADKLVDKDQQELLEVGNYWFGEHIANDDKSLVVTTPDRVTNEEIIFSVEEPNGKKVFVAYEL